ACRPKRSTAPQRSFFYLNAPQAPSRAAGSCFHHLSPFSVQIVGTESSRRGSINEWQKLGGAWAGLNVVLWV
uniref:hypothetical protein n=1 Tax=uncultured Sphingomonas sp. TaxID=158754 RepID=UPI0035CC13BA